MNGGQDHRIRVVLLGASIGKAWDLPALPERVNDRTCSFEYVHGGGWDKTARLREVLSRREGRPDVVVIKQCAAYFPGDLERYEKLMEQWVVDCRQAGVIPLPCTVVPVTRTHSYKSFVNDLLQHRNPLKNGNPVRHRRNRTLLAYNDWLHSFCARQDLSCLDLESVVRAGDRTRYLVRSLARFDGLHVTAGAYRLLDRMLVAAVSDCVRKGKILADDGQAKRYARCT